MNVAVIMKESGKFVCNLSREAAEEMVNDDPDMYGIREADTAEVLLQAAAVIGDPTLLTKIVEPQREPEVVSEEEEKVVTETQKEETAVVVDTPPGLPKPEVEVPEPYVDWSKPPSKPDPNEKPIELLDTTPSKKRDKSPKRPRIPAVTKPVVFLDKPYTLWTKTSPAPRTRNVYQITSGTFFRIRTGIPYNFGRMFGTDKITWVFPRYPADESRFQASFEVENKRQVKNIIDTLKGLGCVEVDYVPWTAEEHLKFSQQ
jgi:hypothetical protein